MQLYFIGKRQILIVVLLLFTAVFIVVALSIQFYREHEFIDDTVFEHDGFQDKTDNRSLSELVTSLEGYGQLGVAVELPLNLSDLQKKLVEDGWKLQCFNQYVSDLISVHRSILDLRFDSCKSKDTNANDKIAATSVIICFYNEAWSTLLRTVHSVLSRSPAHLLKEIILVDDCSELPHLKQQLDDYMSSNDKVKIVRIAERVGLVKARLIGTELASAETLTFLDSHCECSDGWLQPLLERVTLNNTTVASPVIDVINAETFQYNRKNAGGSIPVGGFNWNLEFIWRKMPERETLRRKRIDEPIQTPTIAGGLFSINKEFFMKIGTYDPDFQLWGGENLELSFKTWMCGGTLEIVPCSRVGHVFRKDSPYVKRSDVSTTVRRNSVRVALVWMDQFARFYFNKIGNVLGDYGNITARKLLRKSLSCKSFKWYINNIYPEILQTRSSVSFDEL